MRPVAMLLCAALLLAGCGDGGVSATPRQAGLVGESWMRERQLDYLRFATEEPSTASILKVIAQMERDRVDSEYTAPVGVVSPDAFQSSFEKIEGLRDTRDFDGLYLLNLWLGYRDHPMLAAGTANRIEQALSGFKLWFTEPTPDGLIDDSYYWTENHQLLFHTIEYLVGKRFRIARSAPTGGLEPSIAPSRDSA